MIWGCWISLISHCLNAQRCNCDPAFMKSAFLAGFLCWWNSGFGCETVRWASPGTTVRPNPSLFTPHLLTHLTPEPEPQRRLEAKSAKRMWTQGVEIWKGGRERKNRLAAYQIVVWMPGCCSLCLAKSHFPFLEIRCCLYDPLNAAARLWI